MFKVYGLYDKINKSYIEFTIVKSDLEARSIADGMVNSGTSIVSNFPHDFEFNEIMSILDCGNVSRISPDSSNVHSIQLADLLRKERIHESNTKV